MLDEHIESKSTKKKLYVGAFNSLAIGHGSRDLSMRSDMGYKRREDCKGSDED